MKFARGKQQLLILFFAFFVMGCRTPNEQDLPPLLPTAVLPTSQSTVNSSLENVPDTPTPLPPVTPTMTEEQIDAPAATATLIPQSLPTPTPQPAPSELNLYEVVFVTSGDVLNVRSAAGVDNPIVGTLTPNAQNVQITGAGQVVAGSTWVPIAAGNVQGWVNSRFLTTAVSPTTFCQNTAVLALVEQLKTAVSTQDNSQLAQLIHPERGLRIRINWWNPEVRISGNARSQLFTNNTLYDWGDQDGSGNPIVGTFSEIIEPMLQADLLNATEFACHQILASGTAGIIQLPDGYQSSSYLSFHFPGTSEFDGLDWGTWVVGIEEWQGHYYISYLVHFEWEI